MKRKITLYIHKCPQCEWEAIRGEQQEVNFCSHCGYEGPPVMETLEKEFDYPYVTKTYDEDKEKFKRSAEYLKRLEAGEDPADLDKKLYEADAMRMFEDVCCGFLSIGSWIGGVRSSFLSGHLSQLFKVVEEDKESGLARNEESY